MGEESTPQAGQSPPDPFGPLHAGSLGLLTIFRSHRAAGASLLEAVCLLAASLVAAQVAGEAEDGTQG